MARIAFRYAFVLVALVPLTTSAQGRLDVMSSPLGEVVVDGRRTGRHTPVSDLELPAGPHEVTVHFARTNRNAAPRTVRIHDGRTAYAYFVDRAPSDGLDEACRRGEERACWQRVLAVVEETGDASDPRAVAAMRGYLHDFPSGAYAEAARALLPQTSQRRTHAPVAPTAEEARSPWLAAALTGIAVLTLVGVAGLIVWRKRRKANG